MDGGLQKTPSGFLYCSCGASKQRAERGWLYAPAESVPAGSNCTGFEPCHGPNCVACWVKRGLCPRYLLQPASDTAQIWPIRRKHSNQFAMKDIEQRSTKLRPRKCIKKRSTHETQTLFWRLCLYTASSSAHPSPLLVLRHWGKSIHASYGGLGPTVRSLTYRFQLFALDHE